MGRLPPFPDEAMGSGGASGPDVVVVGAGPAGLACAASLKAAGLAVTVVEQAESVGAAWRRHYDRLHLHTDRDHSGLPGLPMPKSYPKYPSRAQVVDYIEAYAKQFGITPRFGSRVETIRRQGRRWRVETDEAALDAPVVVVATGMAGMPNIPSWPRTDEFCGTIVHSSAYRNPAPYAGQRVLVVGFGNSGGEIALDLAEAGVKVALSVRSPVQVIPRDLLGLPILTWVLAFRRLPARLVDAINAPILRLAIGSIEPLGLRYAVKGPRRMVEEDGRVPLIDVGTLAAVRRGEIEIRKAVDHLTADGVQFADGAFAPFDAIVLATGFRCDLRLLLPNAADVLDASGRPRVTGRTTCEPGLYFCGQITSPTGQLREIGLEASRVANLAKLYVEAAAYRRS